MSERKFPGKTVNFILATKVVASSMDENTSDMLEVNTTWTPEYISQLNTRIDNIASEYMGVNIRNELFKATALLNVAMRFVTEKLVTFKKNIEIDFKGTPDYSTMMSELGLNTKSIHDLTQPQIISMVTNLKRTLTPELIAKITAKGMPASLPASITGKAQEIIDLNTQQEKLKSQTKEATGTMLTRMNDLYKDIIKICKLSADYYKKDRAKKSMFTFTKVMKNMGETHLTKTKKEGAVS